MSLSVFHIQNLPTQQETVLMVGSTVMLGKRPKCRQSGEKKRNKSKTKASKNDDWWLKSEYNAHLIEDKTQ